MPSAAEMRRRIDQILTEDAGGAALIALAIAFRDEGVGQIALYRCFEEFFIRMDGNDHRYDALTEVLEAIWSGPWAKGSGLYKTGLHNEDVA